MILGRGLGKPRFIVDLWESCVAGWHYFATPAAGLNMGGLRPRRHYPKPIKLPSYRSLVSQPKWRTAMTASVRLVTLSVLRIAVT